MKICKKRELFVLASSLSAAGARSTAPQSCETLINRAVHFTGNIDTVSSMASALALHAPTPDIQSLSDLALI